jgi:hypothetical protein
MKATIKIVKYFGNDEGANIFALYIRTLDTQETAKQLTGKTVNITGVDEIMFSRSRATSAQIVQARELLKKGIDPKEVVEQTGCGESTVYKLKKTLDSKMGPIEKATEMLQQGKSTTAAVAATGITIAKAKEIQSKICRQSILKKIEEHTPVQTEPMNKPVTIAEEPPANSVTITRLFREADIQKYGMPANLQFAKIPKEMRIEIGPVGISLAAEVVKSAIEPLKGLGMEDVRIVISAQGDGK